MVSRVWGTELTTGYRKELSKPVCLIQKGERYYVVLYLTDGLTMVPSDV